MILIARHFFKVIKMGENWSAGHQVPEQVGCVSGHRGPQNPAGWLCISGPQPEFHSLALAAWQHKKTDKHQGPLPLCAHCLWGSQKRYTPDARFYQASAEAAMEFTCVASMPNTPGSGRPGGAGGSILFSPKFHSRTKVLVPMSIEIQVWHNPQTNLPMSFQEFSKAAGPALIPNTNSKPHANPNPSGPLFPMLTPQPSEFQPSTHLTLC